MEFKETGLIRRIDDLGRIIIPKEIRRQYRIREGDPLEISSSDGCILFRPYQQHLVQQRSYVKTMYAIFQQACKQQDIKAELTIFDSDGQIMPHTTNGEIYLNQKGYIQAAQTFIQSGDTYKTKDLYHQTIIWSKLSGYNYISSHDLNLYAMVKVVSGKTAITNAILQTISISYKIFLQSLNCNTD